jgi:parallel beta-helix repeat protein
VIAENGYCGVMLAGQSQVLVENNIFYFNKQYGIFTSEGARRSRIVNNNFFGNRSSGNQFSNIDQTNLYTDPDYAQTGPHGHGFWGEGAAGIRGDGKVIGPLKRTFYGAQPFNNDDANQVKKKKPLKSDKNSKVKPVVCTEDDVQSGALDYKEAGAEELSNNDSAAAGQSEDTAESVNDALETEDEADSSTENAPDSTVKVIEAQ